MRRIINAGPLVTNWKGELRCGSPFCYNEAMEKFKLCGALKATKVFSHYAYGDTLPVYARFYDSDGKPAEIQDAVNVFVSCQREYDHEGMHLALTSDPWEDE